MMADKSAFSEILELSEISGDFDGVYSGALEMIQDYADNGNVKAEIYLADMYNYGLGTEKDSARAMKYYRAAGENGDVYSQFMYVNLMLANRNDPPQKEDDEKNYDTGMKYYNAKDYAKAAEIFTSSAKNGHAPSQYMIGRMYEHGQGVSRNVDTAREWYTESSNNGDARAKKALKRLSGSKSWWPF